MTAAIDLFNSMLRLRPGGSIEPSARDFAGNDQGGWTITAFHATDDAAVHADVWEQHRNGDEVVIVIRGRVRAIFRGDDDEAEQRLIVGAGESVLVARERWHRLEVIESADIISVTPRVGTSRRST